MTGRPGTPHRGRSDDGSEGLSPADGHGPRPGATGSVEQGHQAIADVLRQGRSVADGGSGVENSGGGATPVPHPDDARLAEIMNRHDQLGDDPPRFNIAANDAMFAAAHTGDNHGPDIPLARSPGQRTIEGRIHGDPPWNGTENWSFKWTDPSTMNRTINDHVRQNWALIRDELALQGSYDASFDAQHRVGVGFYNEGMFGVGPRSSRYAETSFVKVRIRLDPGADPATPFILTAYPLGIM